ncbi:vitamin K epoxide reductase family protein [Kineosporia rhizophila]|uniref:vitamin K epoxide reductase family protein n=1 Tax=Kineosporia rhizophila TaxID=84633 RepID=UPI001E630362|nr:vitamin K epoxide reductase family protein [Kineosporia rhizophila]MCE0536128.1 vitamin K epoxide reductase family protein [Kineosporia rhizophila]
MTDRAHTSDRPLAWLLLISGAVGTVAAFVLLLERIELLKDDSYVPSCSINPVLNCGSIMRTDQAALFGFPNPIIGVALFPMVMATGAAVLAGARLARWYWLGLQAGVLAGLVFVGWLIFQSLYRIGALCPYCMAVWAVVLPLALYVTRRNLLTGVLGRAPAASSVTRSLASWHALVLTVLFLFVIGLALNRFWTYWSTLLQ